MKPVQRLEMVKLKDTYQPEPDWIAGSCQQVADVLFDSWSVFQRVQAPLHQDVGFFIFFNSSVMFLKVCVCSRLQMFSFSVDGNDRSVLMFCSQQ